MISDRFFYVTTIIFSLFLLFNPGRSEVIVNPHGVAVAIEADAQQEVVITLVNSGNQEVAFEVGIDIRDLEDEERLGGPDRDRQNMRNVRRITSGPVARLSNYEAPAFDASLAENAHQVEDENRISKYENRSPFERGLRRDEPNELRVLLVKGAQDQGFGWFDADTWLEVFADQDPQPDRANINEIGDVDLDEYDLVACGEDQTEQFFRDFMENREIIEDFVDGGGRFSIFAGSNSNIPFELFTDDGDIEVRSIGSLWAAHVNPIFVNDDGDGLIEGIEEDYPILTPFEFFRDGEAPENQRRIAFRHHGGSLTRVAVQQDAIPEDGVWYYRPDDGQQQTSMIADWPFGRGWVFFTGTTGTFSYLPQYRHASMMQCVNLTLWADSPRGIRWVVCEPDEGVIDAEGEQNLTLTLNAEDMEAGVYYGVLEIELDIPEQPILEVPVLMSVDTPVATLVGIVSDEDGGDPVQGVKAVSSPFEFIRISGGEGDWQIADLPLGVYEFTFTSPDYLPLVAEVALDEGGGEFELNVSLLHSECNLSVEGIIADLAPDTDTEVDFSISNDGNGTLNYTSDRRLLGDANAEPWEWRNSFAVGQAVEDDDMQGVVFINEQFYVSGENDGEPSIYVFNRDGELLETIPQVGEDDRGIRDLAWDGELIWGTEQNTIFGFTPAGEPVTSFQGPYRPITAITWDPDRELLWIASTTRGINGVTTEGEEVAELDRHDLRIYGLAYWEDDPDGFPLYVFNKERDTNRQTVHKINPDNDEFEFVAYLEPEAGGNPVGAFITNEYDIYSWVFIDISSASRNAGGDRIDIWQVDARKDWMQIEPEAGVIEADAEQPFVLTLDATGLPPAPFEGEIVFLHNGVGGETHLPVTLNVVEGRVPTERTLELVLGWNMVSVNLQPDERDVTVLTQPLVDEDLLEMMKDGFGHFYNPEFGFNNIPGWFVEQGYMMKVTDDCELTLEGMSVLAEDPIDLVEGWQIVSYYPRRPVEAILALSGIVDQLLIAKDGNGNFYIPEFGFSNMGDLREGQGYQLKMEEAARLVYTLQEEEVARIPQSGRADIPACRHFGTVTPTGENMSLLVTMGSPLSPPLTRGVELGVFTSDGMLVGSGRFDDDGRCGVAIWGDDPTTPELDGARSGERLEIVLQNEEGRHCLSYTTLEGDAIYTTDALWVITLNLEAAIPSEFGIVSAYPNPFNDQARLIYNLRESGKIWLLMFDTHGRRVKNILSNAQPAGMHSIVVDGSDLSNGIYIIQLEAGGRVSRSKITLVK